MEEREQEELVIAKSIIKKLDIFCMGDSGEFFRRKNDVYVKATHNQIDNWITDEYMVFKRQYTRYKKNTTYDFLRTLAYVDSGAIYDSTKDSINLLNGVYWLEPRKMLGVDEEGIVRELYSHFKYHKVKGYYAFTQIPVNYDENAKCPTIDKFIDDIFGKDKRDLVYEFIGYILLPHVKYQRAMILVGSGKNGKTTFLDLLIKFIGENNIAMIALHELEDRFSMINLRNKMANIVSDLPSRELRDTGNAKMVVTDNFLSGNIKNVQGSFLFPNRCKMIYSCNKLPRTQDLSSAFFRRWIMFMCDAVFDKKNADVNILEKITTPEELSGLFNRAIEGIKRLQKKNGFNDTTDEVKEVWEADSNPVADFILNCCILKKGIETRSTELFTAFNKFRSERKLPIFDYRKTGYWLRQFGIVGIQKPSLSEDDDKKKWYTFYQDIGIKENYISNKQKRLKDYE